MKEQLFFFGTLLLNGLSSDRHQDKVTDVPSYTLHSAGYTGIMKIGTRSLYIFQSNIEGFGHASLFDGCASWITSLMPNL
jgi:hypothetical protein